MPRQFSLRLSLFLALLTLILLPGCESAMDRAAGSYDLDKTQVKAAMQKEIDKLEDPAEKAQMSMMMGMIDAFSMTLTLNADGTATGEMGMGGDSQDATGTWTINGDQVSVTLAAEGEEPETMSGTLSGDTLKFDPPEEEDVPFDLVFTRTSK